MSAKQPETGAEWAEIARLEAIENGGPFWCPTCGIEITRDETACDLEYGVKCGATILFGSEQ